ncbi:MAG: GIY-YIG nuclease family protein [Chryseolinea sp.]
MHIIVSADLHSRIVEHREKVFPKSFTARYNLYKLVYYETFPTIEEAKFRESQLKAGSRKKKMQLINQFNSEWKDLFDEIKYW